MAYKCRILQLVLLEEGFYVFGEGGVVVDLIVGGFAVVSRVDGVYGTLEDACEGAGISCQSQSSYDSSRRGFLLSNTLVVPLAPKQAMYNHNRISVRLA